MRHRSTPVPPEVAPTGIAAHIARINWDESQSPPRWDGEPSLGVPYWPRLSNTFDVYDEVAWSKPYMQDLMSERTHYDVTTPPFSWKGHSTGYVTVQTIGKEALIIPTEMILQDCISYAGLTIQEMFHFFGASATGLYTGTLSTPQTRNVVIKDQPFDTDFSIWYLITDLKELPKLASSLLQGMKAIRALARAHPLRTINEIINLHLANKYGVQPTLDDLRDFIRLFIKWGTYIAKQDEKFGKLYTLKSPTTELVTPFEGTNPVPFYWTHMGVQINLLVEFRIWKRVLCQTTKYYFVCQALTDILSRMKQLVDLLGILDVAAAIWDKVPFSFVVDWVVDVTGWLHNNLKPRLFPVDCIIADWCESIHQDITASVTASYDGPSDWLSDGVIRQSHIIGSVATHVIARKRQFPARLSINASKLQLGNILKLDHIITGACLTYQKGAGQRFRKGKSPRYRTRSR